MFSAKKDSAIFTFGGIAYGLLELLWRGRTHWSMVLTGGVCFLSLYKIFKKLSNLSLLIKCILGSSIITIIEFCVGCVVNIWLKLKVWDYSKLPFNIKGQICLLYSTLWSLICIPINYLCKVFDN